MTKQLKNTPAWLKIISLFLIFRIWWSLLGVTAETRLEYQPTFPYWDSILAGSSLPRYVYSWANFDGVHYLTIMEKGYIGTGLIQAFFPVYPTFSAIINWLLGSEVLSGLLVSNTAFLIVLLVWWQFIAEKSSPGVAWWSTIILISLPTSFFFGALYSESVFLLFVIGSFWAVQAKKIWLAVLLVMFASATRIVGIVLVPVLILEILLPNWPKLKLSYKFVQKTVLECWQNLTQHYTTWSPLLLGSLGLVAYSLYLWWNFKDPFYFATVQNEFGTGRSTDFVLWPQVVWRATKVALTTFDAGWQWLVYVLEWLAGVAPIAVVLGWWRYFKPSEVLFTLAVVLIPPLTGTFSSMPRYVLVAWPLWFFAAKIAAAKPRAAGIVLLISLIVQAILLTYFIQGYWVA